MKKILLALAAVVAIAVLGGCGSDPSSSVSVPETVKTVTPQSCLDALDAADAVIATAGEALNTTADAMGAAATFDANGIKAATEKLTELNTQMTPQAQAYKTAREACRG